MDTLDVRILRCFLQGQTLAPITPAFRTSVRAIAKTLGEDEDLVRHRLRRIHESGFLGDTRLYLNPSLWGGGHAAIEFATEPTSSKQPLLESLRLIPGITHVGVFYDSMVALLDFDPEHPLAGQAALVRQLAGASKVAVAIDAFPECRVALTGRDWDLIRALRRDPRKSYLELAQAVELSTRTTKVRLGRILEQGAAFAWPTVNMHSSLGGTFVQLTVRYPSERKAELDAAITAQIEPYLWHVYHLLPPDRGDLWPCGYNLAVPTLAAGRRALDSVRQIHGVQEAKLHVYDGIVNFFDLYDEELGRRLRRMPTALPIGHRLD